MAEAPPARARTLAEVPDADRIPDAILAVRAAWRAWIEAEGWAPLAWLDPRWAPSPAAVERAARQAAGGWLVLGPGAVDPALWAVAEAAAAAHGVRLVPCEPPPAGELPRLRWEDHHHLVASDPSLARQRAALLAHCRHDELVLLEGPPGSGRRSLARWAHARLAATPLAEPGAQPAPVPADRWRLVADPGEPHLGLLRSLLSRAQAPPPAAPPRVGEGERPSHPAFAPLIGRDPALCDVLRRAEAHAPHPWPALLLGETGTGKELLARAIHAASGRRGPLVCIDLGTLGEELAASTLFGHRRGAYTGAERERQGAFRQAHQGTLFLDELGNLSLDLQARLLRVLETGEVLPLGADRPEPVDVRVVAATNEEPEQLVLAGRFRRDLLHRLDTVVLRLPPLRERPGDIGPLATHLLAELGQPPPTPAAVEVLAARSWPGNVRQLRNTLRAAAVEAHGAPLTPAHLGGPATVRAPVLITSTDPPLEHTGLTRAERQVLAALTLRVPAPAQRGPLCVRNAVLAGLGGRALTDEALAALESWPWWGHLVELHRKLATLRREAGPVVDLATLARLFPDMAEAPSHAPISVLLEPSIRPDGSVRGLRSDHHTAALVLGRARRLPPPGDPRAAWLEQVLPEGELDLVTISHLPELSRLHVLVSRGPGGLRVHRLPDTRLEVRAGPLGGPLRVLPPGGGATVGEAAQVHLVRGGAADDLELFVFLGPQALHAATAALRDAISLGPARPTLAEAAPVRPRIWALDEDEARLLVAVLLDAAAAGEDVAPALRRELVGDHPHGARLAAYVDSSNPTQSVGRLFEHPANGPLRHLAREALARRHLSADVLPARVRRAIEQA